MADATRPHATRIDHHLVIGNKMFLQEHVAMLFLLSGAYCFGGGQRTQVQGQVVCILVTCALSNVFRRHSVNGWHHMRPARTPLCNHCCMVWGMTCTSCRPGRQINLWCKLPCPCWTLLAVCGSDGDEGQKLAGQGVIVV